MYMRDYHEMSVAVMAMSVLTVRQFDSLCCVGKYTWVPHMEIWYYFKMYKITSAGAH